MPQRNRRPIFANCVGPLTPDALWERPSSWRLWRNRPYAPWLREKQVDARGLAGISCRPDSHLWPENRGMSRLSPHWSSPHWSMGVQRHRVRATTNSLSSRPEPERQRRRSGGTCCLMNAESSGDERFCETSENVPSVPMSREGHAFYTRKSRQPHQGVLPATPASFEWKSGASAPRKATNPESGFSP